MHSTLVYHRRAARVDPAAGTLIFLHDYESCSEEAVEICRHLNRDFAVLAPESTRPSNPVEGRIPSLNARPGARSWFITADDGQIDPASFGDALKQAEVFLSDIPDPADDRISPFVLLGQGQGGALALMLAVLQREKLRGVVGFDPWVPDWIDEVDLIPEDLSNLPVLLMETDSRQHRFATAVSQFAARLTDSGAAVETGQVSGPLVLNANSTATKWISGLSAR